MNRDATEQLVSSSASLPVPEGTSGDLNIGSLSNVQRWCVGLCLAIELLDGFDGQAIAFAGPGIMAGWRLSPTTFASVVSAGLVGTLIGTMAQGPISDRYGRRPVLLWSFSAIVVLTLAAAGASSPFVLAGLRFLNGLALGASLVNGVTLASEYAPQRMRAQILAIVASGLPLGVFVGGLLSSTVVERFGWRSIFLCAGSLALALLVALWRRLPESRLFLTARTAARGDERGRNNPRTLDQPLDPQQMSAAANLVVTPAALGVKSRKALLRHGQWDKTLCLWIVFFVTQFPMFGLFTWLAKLLSQNGMTLSDSVIAVSLVSLGNVVGGIILGRVADATSITKVMIAAYLASAALCVVLGATVGAPAPEVWLVTFALGFAVGGAQLVAYGLMPILYDSEVRASGVGAAVTAARVGAIVGPMGGAALIQLHLSTFEVFSALAPPLIIAAAAVLVMSMRLAMADRAE
jgi:AAHS family 4-hydroxybenzoate transporter-like MFS transporter